MASSFAGASYWLVVLAEAEGLRWVLENRRMAWTEGSSSRSARVRPGDGVILYVSRGAFHNPTRDEAQVIGVARVSGPVSRLRRPLTLAGREFVTGCDLIIDVALPERAGVPVRPLVKRLSFVKRKEVWGQYFRSGLVELPPQDFKLLSDAARSLAGRAARPG